MKIAVLISGGVDSSVALKMLKEEGHELTAYYLKIWLEDELSFLGTCPWEEDLKYARAVCEQEGVPLEVISLQEEYHTEVVAYTLAEIKAGRTPNPDILCNQRIKFGLALTHIGPEFDKVATGHYAHVEEDNGLIRLSRTPDPVKDQTYFLSYLNQEQLKKIMFPLGNLTKEQVRQRAIQYDLATAVRKDSQGICFLGKVKFADFIRHYLGEKSGELIEFETGKVVGQHKGFYYYTVGQRQGIGLAGGPWYVVKKDPDTNRVYISKSYYAEDKKRDTLLVKNCNWILGSPPQSDKVSVKLRHGPAEHSAIVNLLDDQTVKVHLEDRDQGIAPGQFVVFYEGDVCLGAGSIAEQV